MTYGMTDLDRLCWVEEAHMRRRLSEDEANAERLASWRARLHLTAQECPSTMRAAPAETAKVTNIRRRAKA